VREGDFVVDGEAEELNDFELVGVWEILGD